MKNRDSAKRIYSITLCTLVLIGMCFFSGCATFRRAKEADSLETEIQRLKTELAAQEVAHKKKLASISDEVNKELARTIEENNARLKEVIDQKNKEIDQLRADKEQAFAQLVKENEAEVSDLEKAQKELAESLKQEISDYKAKLEMTERGLVITFLAEIFFDSGKDVLRDDAKGTLDKVAPILKSRVPNSALAVEGHTDNDPITYSAWKSNWELSTGRALAVLHYLIDEGTINPERLSAVGYGEYHPVASNELAKGKQQNRRVEIVILPEKLKKVRK